MSARKVRNCPGLNAKASFNCGGTANVMAAEPAASGVTRLISSGWKCRAIASVGLEVVEGFQAVQALVERLASRGTEMRGFGRVRRCAVRAGNGRVARQRAPR